MSLPKRLNLKRKRSRGATAVEVAFVMPVFLVFLFMLIEYGHMMWVNNMLSAAARNGARYGSLEDATNADVEQYVRDFMRGTVDPSIVEIQIKDLGLVDSGAELPISAADYDGLPDISLDEADSRQLFAVRAKVNFGDAAFLSFPGVDNLDLYGQAIMRRE